MLARARHRAPGRLNQQCHARTYTVPVGKAFGAMDAERRWRVWHLGQQRRTPRSATVDDTKPKILRRAGDVVVILGQLLPRRDDTTDFVGCQCVCRFARHQRVGDVNFVPLLARFHRLSWLGLVGFHGLGLVGFHGLGLVGFYGLGLVGFHGLGLVGLHGDERCSSSTAATAVRGASAAPHSLFCSRGPQHNHTTSRVFPNCCRWLTLKLIACG